MTVRGDQLKESDLFLLDGFEVELRVVSDHVGSAPPDQLFDGIPASDCIEPLISFRTKQGRREWTYCILGKATEYEVVDR